MPLELSILIVADAVAWASWLTSQAATSPGVWLTLAKKGTTSPTTLTYAHALDEALCHGWIDGQKKSNCTATFLQRFTPRTAKSTWSLINVGHVARLEAEGRMQDAGRAAVNAARADGRWGVAYAGQATMEVDGELLGAIEESPEAKAMWEGLSRQNRYATCLRLGRLKTEEGRRKRIRDTVEMLRRGETVYPQGGKETGSRPAKVTKAPAKFTTKRRGNVNGTAATAPARIANSLTKVTKASAKIAETRSDAATASDHETRSHRPVRGTKAGRSAV